MITLLSRLFIPDYENYSSPKVRQAYGILTGSVGIFFNFFLFVLKIVAGMISHSIAITADAFNNLSDAGSSVITLIGFKMSGQEATILMGTEESNISPGFPFLPLSSSWQRSLPNPPLRRSCTRPCRKFLRLFF